MVDPSRAYPQESRVEGEKTEGADSDLPERSQNSTELVGVIVQFVQVIQSPVIVRDLESEGDSKNG